LNKVLFGPGSTLNFEKEKTMEIKLKVIEDSDGNLDGHLLIKRNDNLTWAYEDEFYIQFDDGYNPCDPPNGGDPNTYPSQKEGNLYKVKCKVKADTVDLGSFPYSIGAGAPPTVADPAVTYPSPTPPGLAATDTDGHCEGCCFEADSTM
jgi:hypothetical protein